MIKRLILTYYYVWFQGHKRSKYAKDFSHYWYSAFLQLVATQSFILFNLLILIDMLFDFKITSLFGKHGSIFLIGIIPSLLLYYLLFNIYNADKENDEPTKFGINITKRSKVFSWAVFILAPLSMFALMYFAY